MLAKPTPAFSLVSALFSRYFSTEFRKIVMVSAIAFSITALKNKYNV